MVPPPGTGLSFTVTTRLAMTHDAPPQRHQLNPATLALTQPPRHLTNPATTSAVRGEASLVQR